MCKKSMLGILLFLCMMVLPENMVSAHDGAKPLPYIQETEKSPHDSEKWITSGAYTYRVINENSKIIEIRGIDCEESRLVIPSQIDGYTVIGVGYYHDAGLPNAALEECLPLTGSARKHVTEISIPETVDVIGAKAFSYFEKLKTVNFPENMDFIRERAFTGCEAMEKLELPNHVTIEGGAFFGCSYLEELIIRCVKFESWAFSDEISVLRIGRAGNSLLELGKGLDFAKIETCIVDSDVEAVDFSGTLGEPSRIDTLIVNGKDTKLKYRKNAGSEFVFQKMKVRKNAKAIAFARRNRINYETRTVGAVEKIKCKEKNGKYRFSWRTDKTSVSHHIYRRDRWRVFNREIETTYRVWGKEGEHRIYYDLGTVDEGKITTAYPHIKVKPVRTWEADMETTGFYKEPVQEEIFENAEDISDWKSSGIYQYEMLDEKAGEIAIRRITTEQESLKIPKKLDGYRVVEIGTMEDSYTDENPVAFYYSVGKKTAQHLRELIVPEGVKRIGRSAFAEYTKLENIILPKSLTRIGISAFPWGATLRMDKLKNTILRTDFERYTYEVKVAGSVKKISRKKTKKGYRFSWNKVKTKVNARYYHLEANRWITTPSKCTTHYIIYGKKSKKSAYERVKVTTDTKFSSKKYKYVKVKVWKGF